MPPTCLRSLVSMAVPGQAQHAQPSERWSQPQMQVKQISIRNPGKANASSKTHPFLRQPNQIVKIIQNGSNILKEMSEMRNSAEFWGHSSQDTVDADGPG